MKAAGISFAREKSAETSARSFGNWTANAITFLFRNQAAWLDGIESAFFFFGGVPLALLADNSKCLITAHRHRGGVQLTQSYRHFCQYWAVKPIASTPYHPQSKGKVDRAVRYVKENALAGQKVQSLQELNLDFSSPGYSKGVQSQHGPLG